MEALSRGDRRRRHACPGIVRGRTSEVVCGDRVACGGDAGHEGVIEAVDPRSSLFLRSAPHRAKPIAANVTQVAIVVATEPSFSDEDGRARAGGGRASTAEVVHRPEQDRSAGGIRREAGSSLFAAAGCRIVETSALRDAAALRRALEGETTLLVG